MIYLTEAPNDQELLPLFGGLAMPAPLPHGDFAFFGYWEEGRPISICGERKKTGDLVTCITNSGRYLAQWQSARAAGFERIFLIVEGVFRPGSDGLLEVKRGKDWRAFYPHIEHRRFYTYLDEVANYLGVQVKLTHNPRETALAVTSLYFMYRQPPEEHNSLKQFYVPPNVAPLFGRPSLIRRIAKEFDGIGWDRSRAVEDRFRSVYEMINAGEKEWQAVNGIGKRIAKQTVEDIRRDAK